VGLSNVQSFTGGSSGLNRNEVAVFHMDSKLVDIPELSMIMTVIKFLVVRLSLTITTM
jgi:hypothetical protein